MATAARPERSTGCAASVPPMSRHIVTGGRPEDWVTESGAPVPRRELALWDSRRHAAETVLADTEHDHAGLALIRTIRSTSEPQQVGATEVLTVAALLQAAVAQAVEDGDEPTAWAAVAAMTLAR